MRKITLIFKLFLVVCGLFIGNINVWADDASVQHFGGDEQTIWTTSSSTTNNILHGSTVTLKDLVMTFGGSTDDDKWVWIGDKNNGVVSNMPNTGSSSTGVTSVVVGDNVPTCGGTYKFVPSTTGVLSIDVKGGGVGKTDGAGYLYLVTVDEGNNNKITEIVSSKAGYATSEREKYHLIAGNTYYFFQCAISASNVTSGRLTLKKISYQTSVPVTVTEAGYATFSSPYPLDLTTANTPDGLTAYYIAEGNLSKNNASFTAINQTVAAGEGILLKGAANIYNIKVAASGTDLSDNALVATDGNAIPANNYVFAYETENPSTTAGFYYVNEATAAVPAGKAYLNGSKVPSSVKSFIFGDDTATGVDAPVAAEAEEDGVYYNLNGQQVTKDYKGIVIVNGKKFYNK